MKKRKLFIVVATVLSALGAFLLTDFADADQITVTGPFHFRDNRSANSVGISAGDRLQFGAESVNPTGDNGTTGLATQGATTISLPFVPLSVNPDFFSSSVRYNSSLTGQWTLTFTNETDSKVVLTPAVLNAPQLPFPSSVAISGSGLTPTFSWAYPSEFTLNGVRIQVWDMESGPVGDTSQKDIIHTDDSLPGNATSYTVPTQFSSGKKLEQGHLYSFEISPVLTRGVPLGGNHTILDRSRAFFNFVPLAQGSPPNVFLPIVVPGPTPVYSFNVKVEGEQTIFIDPVVAIGYEYRIGAGDPNFASVTLPIGIGNNLYDLYLINGQKYFFKAQLTGGVPYYFNSLGVDRFLILGIEKEVGLNPDNPTAFITGLTFTGVGSFTGTMTPIAESVKIKVTGGGSMLSKAGAYKINPALEGYSYFNLVANFTKGTPLPEGVAEFILGDYILWFRSDIYQGLTINESGKIAQVKGTGTINNKVGYSFIIWAGDISKGGGVDTFRIRIWETTTGNVVYDNGVNEKIDGGSITIFKE